MKLLASIEQRSPADVLHAALADYVGKHKGELSKAFSDTQKAIAKGDLESLTSILSASVEDQADEAMNRLQKLR